MISTTEKNSQAMQRILALLAKKSNMSSSDISKEAFIGLTTPSPKYIAPSCLYSIGIGSDCGAT